MNRTAFRGGCRRPPAIRCNNAASGFAVGGGSGTQCDLPQFGRAAEFSHGDNQRLICHAAFITHQFPAFAAVYELCFRLDTGWTPVELRLVTAAVFSSEFALP